MWLLLKAAVRKCMHSHSPAMSCKAMHVVLILLTNPWLHCLACKQITEALTHVDPDPEEKRLLMDVVTARIQVRSRDSGKDVSR